MFIVKNKKIFIGISVALVILSVLSMILFRLDKKLGIDFTGGALTEVAYTDVRPPQTELVAPLEALNFGTVLIQPTGERGYIIKSRYLSDSEHTAVLAALSENGTLSMEEKGFNSIGPSIGRELKFKALILITLVSLAIICFIAFAFRKVSKPISSWKYGIITVITLLHDVAIPIGIFTIFSHYYGAEVDALFVVAVLTVLGLSVSDTIVVFDRIRENLHNKIEGNFESTVGRSLEQSYQRSINTSFTVILVLLSLAFFGPISTRYFALMLTAGMFFGTYSSIFLASPLLVLMEEWQNKK